MYHKFLLTAWFSPKESNINLYQTRRQYVQFTSTFQLLAVLCVVDSIFLVTNALACGSAFGVEKGKADFLLLLMLLLLLLLLQLL